MRHLVSHHRPHRPKVEGGEPSLLEEGEVEDAEGDVEGVEVGRVERVHLGREGHTLLHLVCTESISQKNIARFC